MEDKLVVDIQNIFLKREETEVFQDFSWKVRSQEHWFLMGSNGCGKTSLLEIIMGYLWPQKGTVRVLGETFGEVFIPDLRKRIGLVSPWIFRRMRDKTTIMKVVASGVDASVGYWGDVPAELQKKVIEKLDFFHCADLSERPFGSLSSGQQFKIILARAIINDPELLLLDEPFSQLDIRARMESYDFVDKLRRNHDFMTVLLVTHHLEDIADFYTHGLLFKENFHHRTGLKEEVLGDPFFQRNQ